MLKKILFITGLFFCLIIINVTAQIKTELILRHNIGIGLVYNTLKFSNPQGSGEMIYSPGGGMGIEVGLGFSLNKNIEVYGTMGYHQNLALNSHTSNMRTDRTSFSFNRKTFLFGANYQFRFTEGGRTGLKFGGGGSYNIPGTMSITELNVPRGNFRYGSEFGFHFETGFFHEFKKFAMVYSARYRHLNFDFTGYRQVNNFSSSLYFLTPGNSLSSFRYRSLNASGIDISITFRIKLN
ncbi:MAG: outer membrane beta-barrel protein [Cytophagaceae bacterium]